MILVTLQLVFNFVEAVIFRIPSFEFTPPDVSVMVTHVATLGFLLPMSDVKLALFAGVFYLGIRIVLLPVRHVVVLVRGVSP